MKDVVFEWTDCFGRDFRICHDSARRAYVGEMRLDDGWVETGDDEALAAQVAEMAREIRELRGSR